MLSLEPLLRARLAGIAGLKGVYGRAELGAEKLRPTPCVYLVFAGARVADSTADYTDLKLLAQWMVVLAVRNVAQADDGAAAREDAQPLFTAILRSLQGWRPAPGVGALHLIEAPSPDYAAGTLYLPLLFETTQVLTGDQET